MSNPRDLVTLLLSRAEQYGDETLYTFLDDHGRVASTASYRSLAERAASIAARLQSVGAAGKAVFLIYPPGMDYIIGFFGCLCAGAIAVPVYPPMPATIARALPRLRAIARDAEVSLALTTDALLPLLRTACAGAPELSGLGWLATDDIPVSARDGWRYPTLSSDIPAFLQYTSGSTGTPKGVHLGHENLLHNLMQIHDAFHINPDSVAVIWLPPYHDMGLIGGILEPLYGRMPTTFLSPLAFIRRPMLWLETISRVRGTISGGPDFGYALCVRKSTPEQRESLDLGSWEMAFSGADMVRPGTLDDFTAAFAPAGFRRRAFYPCYGLAEGTLLVTGGAWDAEPVIAWHGSRAAAPGPDDRRALVGCGWTRSGQELLIVDPETGRPRADGQEGEIWIRGSSVARGYWRQPARSERVFAAVRGDTGEGPFLRTGDLGIWSGGQLFVTGRMDDLIIIRGRNYYPSDLEAAVSACHPAIRPGNVVVFAVDRAGETGIGMVAEIRRGGESEPGIVEAIRAAIWQTFELAVSDIALVNEGAIPKTSSGKLERRACKVAYLANTLSALVVERRSDDDRGAPDGTPAIVGVGVSEGLRAGLLDDLESCAPGGSLEPAWLQPLTRALCHEVARLTRRPVTEIDAQMAIAGVGLDSLSAHELLARIDDTLGVALSLADVLRARSLADLARTLGTAGVSVRDPAGHRRGEATDLGGNVTAPADASGPLAPEQRRFWLIEQLHPGKAPYNIGVKLTLAGRLDAEALERAIGDLVDAHGSLRTVFVQSDEGVESRITSPARIPLERVDGAAGGAGHEVAADELRGWTGQPFDLERGPLVRARLYKCADDLHVLLCAFHHIAVDGQSFALLARELELRYAAHRLSGSAVAVGASGTEAPYVAYAQAAQADRATRARDVAYACRALAGAPNEILLPEAHPRSTGEPTPGRVAVYRTGLPAGPVRALARAHGQTLFSVLASAFGILMGRTCGQDDLVIGVPVSRRPSAFRSTVGLFVNTVALRIRPVSETTVQAFMAEVQERVLEALAHGSAPLEEVAAGVRAPRGPQGSPLFNTLLALQPAPRAPRLLDLEVDVEELAPLAMDHDLTLALDDDGDTLHARWIHDARRFDESVIRRLAERLPVILDGMRARPDALLGHLPMLTAHEREREHTRAWSGSASVAHARDVWSLFCESERRAPDAPALWYGARSLRYRELRVRAESLARRLRASAHPADQPVALCCERSVDAVIAVLACLAAGVPYLPLDPGLPTERLAFMLRDAEVSLILTDERSRGAIPEDTSARCWLLDGDAGGPDARSSSETTLDEPAPVSPEALAYIIYTSGTSGRPKGVMIRHGGLSNYVGWAVDAYRVHAGTRAPLHTSLAFDLTVTSLLVPLAAGGQVSIVAPDHDARHLAADLLAHPRDFLAKLTPAHMTFLAAHLTDEQLGTLRGCFVIGGEALDYRTVARFVENAPAARLINEYGPTETVVGSVFHEIVPPVTHGGSVPIGRPISNTGAHVLDDAREPVGIGVIGELYLSGAGLARGYLGRPAATASAFVTISSAGGADADLVAYRTGDLVYWREDATLVYVGRADTQVKIRGQRIELGEVEATLTSHPHIRAACVLPRTRTPGDEHLVAYVVVTDAAADVREWRSLLRARLPEVMQPRFIVPIDTLPLTPHGKVDRRALQALAVDDALAGARRDGDAPRSLIEDFIVRVWSELLGVEGIGAHDDFFALGGHSLLAVRACARLGKALDIDLPVHVLFEQRTAAALAGWLGRGGDAGEHARTPLTRLAADTRCPASFSQQMWLLYYERSDANRPRDVRNVPLTVRIHGPLDERLMARVLEVIIERHEPLRTRFEIAGQDLVQIVEPAAPVLLLHADLTEIPAGEREQALADALARDARHAFELEQAPPLRVHLYRIGAEEHALMLLTHHIAFDGWSTEVFVRELSELYRAVRADRAPDLPDLPIRYRDFSCWEAQRRASGELEEHYAYWRERMGGRVAIAELPTDRPRPRSRSYGGVHASVVLDEPLRAALEQLSRAHKTTRFTTMLAAYKALLAQRTGVLDLVVASNIAGRTRPEVEGLIGCFINLLAFRTQVDFDLSFREFARRVEREVLTASLHQEVPYHHVLDMAQPREDLARAISYPLFNMAEFSTRLPDIEGLSFKPLSSPERGAVMNLSVTVVEAVETPTQISAQANADLYDAATIEGFVHAYRELLSRLTRAPSDSLLTLCRDL
jgi:amino acid adenylation domain-containing protein